MILIGPVIQVFYASPVTAKHMHYLGEKLEENLAGAHLNSGRLDVYNDTSCRQALLDTWDSGDFKKMDVVLQFSIDGA